MFGHSKDTMLPTTEQPVYQAPKSAWNLKTVVSAVIGVAILLMIYATFFTSCDDKGQSTAKSLGCSLASAGNFISKNLTSIYALIWTGVIAGIASTIAGIWRGRKPGPEPGPEPVPPEPGPGPDPDPGPGPDPDPGPDPPEPAPEVLMAPGDPVAPSTQFAYGD